MRESGLDIPLALAEASSQLARRGTPVWLADNAQVLGLLGLKDPIRPDSADAVRALQRREYRSSCAPEITAYSQWLLNWGFRRCTANCFRGKEAHRGATAAAGHKVGMVGDGKMMRPRWHRRIPVLPCRQRHRCCDRQCGCYACRRLMANVAVAISRATLRNIKAESVRCIGSMLSAFLWQPGSLPVDRLAAGTYVRQPWPCLRLLSLPMPIVYVFNHRR